MKTVKNPTKALLQAGKLSLGVGVRVVRGVEIAPIMASAGYDFLFIDLEHGPTTLEGAFQISTAALDAGITPLVRVPQMELRMAARALDSGAQGIVMPHVDTVEEARAIVDALRFAPLGHRSIAGGYPHFGFAPRPATDVVSILNEETLVVVMLETPEAIGNAERIAAIPGIDVLLVGTNDLSLEMGIPGQLGDDRIATALQRVVDACRAHGKYPGTGGIYSKDLLKRYVPLGMRFVLAGGDLGFLFGAAQDQASFARGLGAGG